MDTKETTAAEAAVATVPQNTQTHMCLSITFLSQRRNHFSTNGHVLPIVTQKQRGDPGPIELLPKGLSIV